MKLLKNLLKTFMKDLNRIMKEKRMKTPKGVSKRSKIKQ